MQKNNINNEKDYHQYVFKNGKFIGKFEDMYKNCNDPWNIEESGDKNLDHNLIIALLKSYKPYNNILEAGCGIGRLANKVKENLKEEKFEITGVDISKTAIEKAKKKYKKIKFISSDLIGLNLNKRFDLIICASTLYYFVKIKDVITVLKTFDKHLAKNGKVCISYYLPKQTCGEIKNFDMLLKILNKIYYVKDIVHNINRDNMIIICKKREIKE